MNTLTVSQKLVPGTLKYSHPRRGKASCLPSQLSITRDAATRRLHGLSPLLSSRPRIPIDAEPRFVTRSQNDSQQGGPEQEEKIPFGYTRKDVLVIGVALTAAGYGLRYGLEYIFGLDPLQAGNVTQLTVVIGLCLGWISTYLWRVGNKEMTYAKQLRDYENAVMEKRLEAMSETELEAMLAEVEEEKQRLRERKAKMAAKE